MIAIQQELAQLQVEFVQLIDRWNGLGRSAQAESWRSYTLSLDEGVSRHHPFNRLLMSAWCEGWNAIGGVAIDREGCLGPAVAPTA